MANLKNTTVDDSGFLRLPVGDTAARPGSPNGRQIRFNTETGKLEQFRPDVGDWIAPNNTGVIATGGDSVYDIDAEGTTYRVHVFTSTGTSTFEVLQGGEAEYLIVAGGGGGGVCYGGGGGAGGLLTGTTAVTPQTYTITVGAGGTNRVNSSGNGGPGGNSLAFGLTAVGGGFGGGNCGNTGGNGGSGGGGSGGAGSGGAGGSGITGQGSDGAPSPDGSNDLWGGGGGGAGSSGSSNNGGIGLVSLINGFSVFFAGGGQGSLDGTTQLGALGGGGSGGIALPAGVADATSNTGGGGGGTIINIINSEAVGTSGIGGSGIVVIRYPLRQENPVTAPGRDVRDGLVLDLDFAKPTVYSGSGSVVTDSRLNGVEGTINGASYINPRTHRSAFEFDGSNDYINLPDFYTAKYWERNGAWTVISAHIIENISDTKAGIFNNQRNKTETNPGGFGVGLSSGSYTAQFTDAISDKYNEGANIDVTLNELEIIIYTWNPLTLTVAAYRNGVLESQLISPNISWSTRTDGNNTRIFRNTQDGWSGYIQGQLFVQQVFNRALSSDEVFEKYSFLKWRFGV